MNTSLKAAAALAAVILVAVVGYSLLPGPSTGVGGPPPSPSPTASPSPIASASPSAASSASAVFPPWYTQPGNGAGILPAGSQTTRQFLVGSTFTIPEGWVNDGDDTPVYSLFPNTPANQTEYALSKQTAQNILLTDTVSTNMFAICDATGLFQGATASKVMDVVVANRALSTTEPVDVTIGGLSGRQVDIQLSPDWTGSCPSARTTPRPETTRTPAIDSSCLTPPLAAPLGSPSARCTRPTSRHSSPRRCRSSRASSST